MPVCLNCKKWTPRVREKAFRGVLGYGHCSYYHITKHEDDYCDKWVSKRCLQCGALIREPNSKCPICYTKYREKDTQ